MASYRDRSDTPQTQHYLEPDRWWIGRRTLLKALGVAGASAAGILATDQAITNSRFDHLTTDVNVFETRGAKNGGLTVVLPGLGVQDSQGTMRALMPTIKEWSQYAASVRLADSGFEVDDIADKINRAHFKLGFNAIHLYGHSMGGTYIPDITSRLDSTVRRGLYAYNCTPWTPDYIYDEQLVEFINALPAEGTYGTKLLTQIIERFFREQTEDLSFADKWKVIWEITNDEGSPKTWLNQLAYLGQRNEGDYNGIPEDTTSIFVAPRNLSSDRTVLLDSAIRTFQDKIPGNKRVLYVAADGHANPRQRPGEYNDTLRRYTEEYPLVFSSLEASARYRQQLVDPEKY